MDIISINIAANRAMMKLKDEGIESLTLNSDDGKQYELVVKDGKLKVVIKRKPGEVVLINFTIEGVALTAEEGMTWEDWIGSQYDSFHYEYGYMNIDSSEERFVGSSVSKDSEYLEELLSLNGSDSYYVYAHETIVPDGAYYLWH